MLLLFLLGLMVLCYQEMLQHTSPVQFNTTLRNILHNLHPTHILLQLHLLQLILHFQRFSHLLVSMRTINGLCQSRNSLVCSSFYFKSRNFNFWMWYYLHRISLHSQLYLTVAIFLATWLQCECLLHNLSCSVANSPPSSNK